VINSESSGEVSRLSAGESIFRGKSARSGGLDSFPRNLGAGGAHADGGTIKGRPTSRRLPACKPHAGWHARRRRPCESVEAFEFRRLYSCHLFCEDARVYRVPWV